MEQQDDDCRRPRQGRARNLPQPFRNCWRRRQRCRGHLGRCSRRFGDWLAIADELDRDVIVPAGIQCQINQHARDLLDVRLMRPEHPLNLRLLDIAGQAVRARRESIPLFQFDRFPDLNLHIRSAADGAAENMGLRVFPRLLRGDHSRVQHPLDGRMVFGQKSELAVAKQVGAAVADVAYLCPSLETSATTTVEPILSVSGLPL